MKKIVMLLALLASCEGTPTNPTPVRKDPLDIAEEFLRAAEKAAPKTKNAVLPNDPLPPQVLSEGELSVTVVGHYGAAQTRDKSWIVQTGPNTRITAYNSSSGSAGAVINLRGNNTQSVLDMQLTLPRSVLAGHALIVVSEEWPVNGATWSNIDEAMAVVFVPYPVSSDMLRPPAIGDGFLPWFFRIAAPIYETQVDMSRCPSVIDFAEIYQPGGSINPNGWGAAPPTMNALLNDLGGIREFSGELVDGWPVASHSPNRQHIGYGTYFSGQVSTSLCFMASTKPLEERRAVALAIVQRGLDQIGATCDERVLYPSGGHCAGRKALVIVAGQLLNVEAFCNPSWFFPNTFSEDLGYFLRHPSAWWFGEGWTAGWAFALSPISNGSQLVNHPSTWGDPNSPNHSTFAWQFTYIQQVVPAQVGTALVMRLMNREAEMGAMCQMVNQWMRGPSQAANAALQGIGYNVPWGTDYATPAGFTAEAYRLYYQ